MKPYVKRGKTDAADAEATCEAVTRPSMRVTLQACLWHDAGESAAREAAALNRKARDFLVRQRTRTVNVIRARLAVFGIVVAKGIQNPDRLLAAAQDVPEPAHPALDLHAGDLRDPEERTQEGEADKRAVGWTDRSSGLVGAIWAQFSRGKDIYASTSSRALSISARSLACFSRNASATISHCVSAATLVS